MRYRFQQLAVDDAASTKSSSDGAVVGVGIALTLLVVGGVAAGLLTRRRRSAAAPDAAPDADA